MPLSTGQPIWFLAVFGLSLILSLCLTPLATRLGRRWNLLDIPGGRRQHTGVVPRSGGIALYTSFVAATLLATVVRLRLPTPEGPDPKEALRLTGILVGSTFLFLVGLYDDRHELGPRPQIAAQLTAALVALLSLVFIERVMNPFTDRLIIFPPLLTVVLTILWVMGMLNTVNFLDGLDGLAASVAAIVAAVLFIHMYRVGQYSVSLLPLALLGSLLGFLPYNSYPARVFMGSTGSFFLGWALATLSIVAGTRMATVLFVLAVPILDVAWLIVARLRQGRTVAQGDRRHLHFRLVELGFSTRQVVLAYCLLSAAFGFVALNVASRMFKLAALSILGLVMLVTLAAVTRLSERRTAPPGRGRTAPPRRGR
jgi:UDP-GlcNAc:undecaprenyl-phosphate GlcNAc-1-phosphate transferase